MGDFASSSPGHRADGVHFGGHFFQGGDHFGAAASIPQQIRDCEARYSNFKDKTPAVIRYNDVPWPLTAHGAYVLFGFEQPSQMHDKDARKQAYKRLITRWHPDKFESSFGSRLVPADKKRILQQVIAVAQEINLANSLN
jgi:hypothetical protein